MDGGTNYEGFGLPESDGSPFPEVFNARCYCAQCAEDRASALARTKRRLRDQVAASVADMEGRVSQVAAAFELFLLERPTSPAFNARPSKRAGDLVVCPYGNGDTKVPVVDPGNGRLNWIL